VTFLAWQLAALGAKEIDLDSVRSGIERSGSIASVLHNGNPGIYIVWYCCGHRFVRCCLLREAKYST